MLELASIANGRAHYLISPFHTKRYYKLSAILGKKNKSIIAHWRTNTFAQANAVPTSGSDLERATEEATKANSWRHRGRNEDFLAARLRQIFSHPPAFITPQKPFQLYVRDKHWSIASAHTNNRIQSSYTSKWLSSSSSAAPLRATPAGSLPSLPPLRSKSLQ